VRFQKLRHDRVLASQLRFKPFDLLDVAILHGLVLPVGREGRVAVLEKLFEPGVNLGGVKVEFIAEVRDGDLVDEMPLEDAHLLRAAEMPSGPAHNEPPRGLD